MLAKSRINRENFIQIQGWMTLDLNLKGNELLIYALIFGFSQAENNKYSGSLQYLMDWTNSTKQSVIKCLKRLEEKGLIVKTDIYKNGVKFCEYQSTKFTEVVNKVDRGGKQSLPGGSQQSLPNNKALNNKEYIQEDIMGEAPKRKRFSPPTLEEVREYCRERKNNVDPQRFIDYYESNGWKVGKNPMKDWKASVRTWERNGFNDSKQGKTVGQSGIAVKSDIDDDKAELLRMFGE